MIAMTASVMQGDREMCLDAGMNDYISKPISFDTLQRALERWSDHSKQIRSPEPISEVNIDFEDFALNEIAKISSGLPKRMINIFISQEAPNLLQKLRQACLDRDSSQIEYAAHNLKGSSRILGAIAFAEVCFDLEVSGREQQLDHIDTLMLKADQLFPTVVSYLEAYLAKCSA